MRSPQVCLVQPSGRISNTAMVLREPRRSFGPHVPVPATKSSEVSVVSESQEQTRVLRTRAGEQHHPVLVVVVPSAPLHQQGSFGVACRSHQCLWLRWIDVEAMPCVGRAAMRIEAGNLGEGKSYEQAEGKDLAVVGVPG